MKILKIFLWCVALVCALARPGSALTDEQFEVAEGLVVQPFAIQGQLSNPASIDVDDRGRVWVAEAFNYRKKTRKAGDRILILEDSNGNGRADKTTVFYQDPDIDGVHGVCALGNKAIVSAPDRILLLTDTDGDDKADAKKLLFTGKVLNPVHGQHDHAIHAVMFGPDGRLYFNFGNLNAGLWHADGTLVRDVFGNPVNNSHKPYQEGMVIRCELDGTRVEVLGYNFRNNWEVTVDSFGTMWQSDNDNGSSSCRVNFVMEYGNYGYRDERTGADYRNKRTNMEATMQRRMWHQNDPGVVPNLLITGSGAPTGILVYEGDLLPEPFRGQMIHAEPGRNVVWAFPAKQAGAGYSARIVDIVRSAVGRNYRPSDVSVAPDGSLFIADWFDPVDCCHRTINDAGRIFRVAPPKHVYAVPAYDFKTPVGAVKALRSPNLSARYKAWTTLLGMQERARPTLEKMATDKNPRFRARALWALAAIKEGTPKAIGTALRDESENIRALALRIARRHQVPLEPLVRRLVHDESALVRRECAVSLHRLTSSETIQLWVELAAQYDGKDRWYLEALGIGEKGKETACLHAWLKKTGADWTTHANRDVVWRSRAPEAAMLLAKLLLNSDVPAAEHPRLLRALDFHSGKPKEAALATLLLSDSKRNPATYLEAFQRATPEFLKAHPKVMNQVESVLLASKGTVTFVDLVARFNRKDMVKHLMDMVQTAPKKEPGIRAAHQIFAFKEDHRIEAALGEPERTTAIIRALGFVGNNQAVAMLRTVTTDEARLEASRLLAITALGRSSSGAGALMQLVQQKKLPAKFMPPAIRSLASSPGPNTRSFAAQQQELLTPAGKRWPIELLLAAKPDASRGKAVFQKAGCIACHIVQGEGLDFGPELSDIGNKLSSEQLFEAILKPNQTISLGYEGVNVTLKDGTQLIGFVTSESKTTLSLRIPGGLRKDVLKANIKTRTAMKASLMPAGLEAAISPQELVDLVGWLAPQNPAETPTAKNARVGGLPELLAEETANTSRPNVVVMMVDDMGFAGPSIAPYGNPHYKTPGMDRLAREGLLFTDFHSSGTVCSPTRAGLLTGRYQQRVGVEAVIHPRANHPEHRKGLHQSEVTFAELFKEAGYVTGVVGKWHLGYAGENPEYHPQNHGFDTFKGYHSGNIDYINHWGDHMKHDWWHGRKETKEKGYTTHLINKYALEFIEQNKDKPFCLYVAHESPHAPVQGPNDPIQRGPGRQPRETPHAEAMKQMILEMDKGVEQVRAKLVELGLEKNTLFLFFSDNGDSPGTATGHPNHRGSKGSVYEGGTRVPAIAWWPGKIKPGTSTDALSITLDVMPTILSVAGIEKPKNHSLDGIDLSPAIFEQKALPPRPLYWGSLSNNGARSEALRDGPWKLVVQHPKAKPGTFENETIELFNLARDESEKNNLAAAQPDRAAAMLKRIKAWYADTQKTASPQPGGWIRKPRVDTTFFNGKDLTGWSTSQAKYWSVKDDAIVGHSAMNVPKNEFIWADGEVRDFYLAIDVKLTPDNRNAGIQFRSKKADAAGQALGYQADVGGGVWGKLYHEHGRGKLDWNNRAAKAVKRGDWNRYEILAVEHRIWTAINGTLCVAIDDSKGELSGKIAFQVHGGPPQTAWYRPVKLVHDPKLELAGLNEKQLLDALPKKVVKEGKPQPKPGWTPQVTAWRAKLDANDRGMIGKWFATAFDDAKWNTMRLPTFYETAGLPGHDGTVWFRRAIEIPGGHAGKPLTLELGPVDDMDMTWFNGIQVGGIERPGFWTSPRKYTVPGKLVKTGRNVIAVRVIDHGWSGGFGGKTTQMRMSAKGLKPVSIAGNWKYQAGITLKALELGALNNPTPPKPIPPPPPAPALVRPLAKTTSPAPAFTNGFQIEGDANIVIVGSANAVESQRHGYLETLLTAAHPTQRFAIRNMAWPADTVYQQQRPRNFFGTAKPSYGEADRRKPLAVNVVFVWLGQSESLEGLAKLDDFTKAYEQTLEQLSTRTSRLVLITPVPFEDPLGLGLDVKKRNANLKHYTAAILRLGQARKLPVVDLTSSLLGQAITRDGATLSGKGQWLAARTIAVQLGLADPTSTIRAAVTGELIPIPVEELRQAILRKNRLWQQFWLPTNWAFLYGNRQQTASSRNHLDKGFRWFPEEVQSIVPQLEQMDSLIQGKARQVIRK